MSKNAKSQRTNLNDPISHYTSLIRSLGRILKLPQNVIYTATIRIQIRQTVRRRRRQSRYRSKIRNHHNQSLRLSLSLTHTHIFTLSLSLSLSHISIIQQGHSKTHTHTHNYTHTHIFLSHKHTHIFHTHTQIITIHPTFTGNGNLPRIQSGGTPRKIRDCLNAYRYHKNLSTSTEDYDYADCKASFVAREQKLLRAIAFDCEVKSPYASCFLMASDLKCDSSVVHLAVALINDSVLLSVDRSTRTSVHMQLPFTSHLNPFLSLPSSWWTPFNITTLEIREAVANLCNILIYFTL